MRTVTAFCCMVVLSLLVSTTLTADREFERITSEGASGPSLVAYFDPGLVQRTMCATAGDTIVVWLAAGNIPDPLEGLSYRITVDSALLTFVDETFEAGMPAGDFHSGVELSFAAPADASGKLLVQTLRFAVTGSCPGGCRSPRADSRPPPGRRRSHRRSTRETHRPLPRETRS